MISNLCLDAKIVCTFSKQETFPQVKGRVKEWYFGIFGRCQCVEYVVFRVYGNGYYNLEQNNVLYFCFNSCDGSNSGAIINIGAPLPFRGGKSKIKVGKWKLLVCIWVRFDNI